MTASPALLLCLAMLTPPTAFTPDCVGPRFRSGPPTAVPSGTGAFVGRDRVTAGEVALQAGGGVAAGAVAVTMVELFLSGGIQGVFPGDRSSVSISKAAISGLLYPSAVAGGVAVAGRGSGSFASAAVGSAIGAYGLGLIGWGIGAATGHPALFRLVGFLTGAVPGGIVGYNWDRPR